MTGRGRRSRGSGTATALIDTAVPKRQSVVRSGSRYGPQEANARALRLFERGAFAAPVAWDTRRGSRGSARISV
jgi:hypothetical protein